MSWDRNSLDLIPALCYMLFSFSLLLASFHSSAVTIAESQKAGRKTNPPKYDVVQYITFNSDLNT